MKKIFACIILILVINCNIYAAEEHSSSLKKINQKIASIQATLSVAQTKRANYLQSLKTTEVAASQASLKLQQTNSTLHKQQVTLQQLQKNQNVYQTKLIAQQNALALQMRSAYLLGRQPALKLLLNESDANHISRLFMYYRYLNQNRMAIIQDLQLTLNQLQRTQHETQTQAAILLGLESKQEAERSKLEELKQNRQLLVSQINNEISDKQQKLAQLLANKKLLEQTITRLENSRIPTMSFANFAAGQGKFSWPTQGKVLALFGTQIYQSELKWDGILIQASENQPVYAVAKGQVVFAKWLPGYGLLLIISHGHGYMTLYGRNHNLYKKSGDTVQAGELIATVGNSGGYDNPALYFAIRHNALPLNPVAWCQKRRS